MKRFGPIALLVCLVAMPLTSWAGGPPKSLEQTLEAAGRFNTYLALQQLAGGGKGNAAKGPRTFLVPNDAAFAAMPPGQLEKLKSNPAQLRKFLDLHTLPGNVTLDDMVGAKHSQSHRFKSQQGATLEFTAGKSAGKRDPKVKVFDGVADASDGSAPSEDAAPAAPAPRDPQLAELATEMAPPPPPPSTGGQIYSIVVSATVKDTLLNLSSKQQAASTTTTSPTTLPVPIAPIGAIGATGEKGESGPTGEQGPTGPIDPMPVEIISTNSGSTGGPTVYELSAPLSVF